ncbi:MAG: hypothetical protein NG712_02160 [Omnitrophica bacterium]|nr:hypothetical protein [Candidatus Omnitrophota bacterium]
MRKIVAIVSLMALFGLCGCATIQESRGDTLEDTRKLIFDAQTTLENLNEKTSIIRNTQPRPIH